MGLAVKIFFSIVLSVSILLSSTYLAFEANTKISLSDNNNSESMSCCEQVKEQTKEYDCGHCSEEDDDPCDNSCSMNCCCLNALLFTINIHQYHLQVMDFQAELIDTYNEQYAYAFLSNIDKPPTCFDDFITKKT